MDKLSKDWNGIKYTKFINNNTNTLIGICHKIDIGKEINLHNLLSQFNEVCTSYIKQKQKNYIDINYDNHKIVVSKLVTILKDVNYSKDELIEIDKIKKYYSDID